MIHIRATTHRIPQRISSCSQKISQNSIGSSISRSNRYCISESTTRSFAGDSRLVPKCGFMSRSKPFRRTTLLYLKATDLEYITVNMKIEAVQPKTQTITHKVYSSPISSVQSAILREQPHEHPLAFRKRLCQTLWQLRYPPGAAERIQPEGV